MDKDNGNTPFEAQNTNDEQNHNTIFENNIPNQGNAYQNQGNAYQGNAYQNQGNAYQGNAYPNQGNAYSNQGNAYQNQGNAYQGNAYSNQGNAYQGNAYPNQGNAYSNQGNSYQGNAYPNQGNAYSNQGNAYQGNAYPNQGNSYQGNAYSNQGNAYQGNAYQGNAYQGNAYPNQGNAYQGNAYPNQGNAYQGNAYQGNTYPNANRPYAYKQLTDGISTAIKIFSIIAFSFGICYLLSSYYSNIPYYKYMFDFDIVEGIYCILLPLIIFMPSIHMFVSALTIRQSANANKSYSTIFTIFLIPALFEIAYSIYQSSEYDLSLINRDLIYCSLLAVGYIVAFILMRNNLCAIVPACITIGIIVLFMFSSMKNYSYIATISFFLHKLYIIPAHISLLLITIKMHKENKCIH